MIRPLLIFLFAFFCTSIHAQIDSTKIAIEQINRIKLDSEHYLYAEVTMTDWMEAYNAAKALLKEQLSSWLVNQQKDDVQSYIVRSDEHIFEIKAQRGNRYRAFVYVKKSDILAFSEERQLMTITSEEVKDKVEEEKLFQIPDEKNSMSNKPTVVSMSAMEKEMLSVTTFSDIEPFISRQQSENKVATYGKYANRPSSGIYYMFVYNRNAEIPAYLKCEDGNILNLRTGKEDTMDSYKNCGAIWFR